MEDYRGHVGPPAKRYMLYCKVSCVRATEHHRDQSGKLQGSVGQMRAGPVSQPARPLTLATAFVEPSNMTSNDNGPQNDPWCLPIILKY